MVSLGIIGGGFSGLVTLAALVRHATEPFQVTIYDPHGMPGRGKAYSTQDPHHLLNVRAASMGAHVTQDDNFLLWLQAHHPHYSGSDFAPRAVYGRYLDQVLADTLLTAQQKDIRVFMAHERVSDLFPEEKGLKVKAVSDRPTYDGIILACGNDRPRVPVLEFKAGDHIGWWDHPYLPARWQDIQKAGHIIILGSGLSMVDALVTLRRERYEGDITVISGHARYPFAHADIGKPVGWEEAEALGIRHLSDLVRQVKLKMSSAKADWRDVLDGLRPHANAIWRNFPPAERQRASRYMSLWNVCRHRIPPEMLELIKDYERRGQLRMMAARVQKVEAMGSSLNVYTTGGVREGQIVINCMGYDYRILPEGQGLPARLARSGLITLQEGFPQPVRPALRMNAGYALYALGPLLQGYFIESTAVREIRSQADLVARDILKSV